MHSIKHKNTTATINPVGAELSSLLKNGNEFLWQGDEQYWTGRAPILFPIVGALKDSQTTINNKTFQMPRHGLARHATFECIKQTDNAITMKLVADANTLSLYPWNFELTVRFLLHDNGLDIRYAVKNNDNNPMLFTIGSHPAFSLDLNSSTSLSDYEIQFNKNETLQQHVLNTDGLLELPTKPYPAPNNIIKLSDTIFDDDALVFRNINSDSISLRCKQQTVLTIDTGGAPHLGLWAKPNAPFVCIEPWLGTSDFTDSDGRFENKSDLTSLLPDDTFSHGIGIIL